MEKKLKDFEIIAHTADLQIAVFGKNENELFKNALIGMFQVIGPKNINCKIINEKLTCDKLSILRSISLESFNIEMLLVDFLSEALYLSDVNNEAYLDVDIIKISDKTIEAILKGIKIEGFEGIEIKAVTYHNLKIIKLDNYIMTNIVFDI